MDVFEFVPYLQVIDDLVIAIGAAVVLWVFGSLYLGANWVRGLIPAKAKRKGKPEHSSKS